MPKALGAIERVGMLDGGSAKDTGAGGGRLYAGRRVVGSSEGSWAW